MGWLLNLCVPFSMLVVMWLCYSVPSFFVAKYVITWALWKNGSPPPSEIFTVYMAIGLLAAAHSVTVISQFGNKFRLVEIWVIWVDNPSRQKLTFPIPRNLLSLTALREHVREVLNGERPVVSISVDPRELRDAMGGDADEVTVHLDSGLRPLPALNV